MVLNYVLSQISYKSRSLPTGSQEEGFVGATICGPDEWETMAYGAILYLEVRIEWLDKCDTCL